MCNHMTESKMAAQRLINDFLLNVQRHVNEMCRQISMISICIIVNIPFIFERSIVIFLSDANQFVNKKCGQKPLKIQCTKIEISRLFRKCCFFHDFFKSLKIIYYICVQKWFPPANLKTSKPCF